MRPVPSTQVSYYDYWGHWKRRILACDHPRNTPEYRIFVFEIVLRCVGGVGGVGGVGDREREKERGRLRT